MLFTASGEIVKKKLGEVSKASVLANLTAVVNGLGLIKQDLSNVDLLTRQLQETALQLDTGIIPLTLYTILIIDTCKNNKNTLVILLFFFFCYLALKECRTIIMKKLEVCRFERACRDILNRFNIQDLSLEANFSQVSKTSSCIRVIIFNKKKNFDICSFCCLLIVDRY